MAGLNDLFNNPKLRSVFLKLRIPISLVLVALLVTQVKREWFLWGLAVPVIPLALILILPSLKEKAEQN